MNKYQEALDEIERVKDKYVNNVDDFVVTEFEIMQKLVDKETPMKVIDHTKQLGGQCYCPKCNRVVLYDEPKYCSNCGQKLDVEVKE